MRIPSSIRHWRRQVPRWRKRSSGLGWSYLRALSVGAEGCHLVRPTVASYSSFPREADEVGIALLDSVKVTLPDQGTVPLTAVASVTIKQGTLYVEVWDTDVSRGPFVFLGWQIRVKS